MTIAACGQGVWAFPDLVEVEVVTQCKNEKKPVGVQYVREFHGVLSFFPASTLGLFASSSGFSVYAQRYANDARVACARQYG